MAEGSKWTPGKIFLLVLGILAGLCLVCSVAGYLIFGEKAKSIYAFGKNSGEFVQRLQKDYGENAIFGIEKNDRAEMVLTIGVSGDLTPQRVAEVQDGSWKLLGEIFGTDGFLPVRQLAVGHPLKEHSGGKAGAVVDWGKNVVDVEELVKRTGVAAPKNVGFLPEEFDGRRMRIKVESGTDTKDDKDGKDEEDRGGGTGGK